MIIGFETARELVKMNAEVVLACRSVDKANQARDSIIDSTKCSPTKVRVIKLDLCSFASVRQFVDDFRTLKLPLHGLINNAGIMMVSKELTPVCLFFEIFIRCYEIYVSILPHPIIFIYFYVFIGWVRDSDHGEPFQSFPVD